MAGGRVERRIGAPSELVSQPDGAPGSGLVRDWGSLRSGDRGAARGPPPRRRVAAHHRQPTALRRLPTKDGPRTAGRPAVCRLDDVASPRTSSAVMTRLAQPQPDSAADVGPMI